MRKRSTLGFAVLLLSLGLAACEQDTTPATTTPAPDTTQIEPAPIPPRAARGSSAAPRSASASRSSRAAAAAPAASVTEVRGSRVAAGERAMADRGYTRVRSSGGTTYWRNARTNRCVRTVTTGGRYTTVATVNARSCRR